MMVMVIKVKSGGTYHSCCAVVRNMQRCVYAVPTVSLIHNEAVIVLEKEIEDSQTSIVTSKDKMAKHGMNGEKLAEIEKDLEESQKSLMTSQARLRAKLHVLTFHVTAIFFLCICTLADYISFFRSRCQN